LEETYDIIVPIYKRSDKTGCSSCTVVSLLPTAYNILPIILVSKLTPHVDEIIGEHRYGFWRRTSITDRIPIFVRYWSKMGEYISYL
jgi:hypothetical protein